MDEKCPRCESDVTLELSGGYFHRRCCCGNTSYRASLVPKSHPFHRAIKKAK